MRALLLCFALAGCTDGAATYGDDSSAQLPPRGHADLDAWLAEGHYLAWRCEDEVHPARPRSGHGSNRICSNELLATAPGTGAFPVGAATVKEVYDGDELILYAVMRKMTDGIGGRTWYWYEGKGDDIIANGEGDTTCTNCHAGAARDSVFTVIQ